jgi:flagellar biosynthesis GTPase FlhF
MYDDFKEMDEAINNLKNDYKKYSGFYLQELKSINIYFIYIDDDNNIQFIKKEKKEIENSLLSKDDLTKIIKEKMYHNGNKFGIISLLKYNINIGFGSLSDYMTNTDNYNFLTTSGIEDIKWDQSVLSFHNMNGIYVLFKEINRYKKAIEQERLEQERLEQERLEQERLEQERQEKEMKEKERQEKEMKEKERQEKERQEKEMKEKEMKEKERQSNKIKKTKNKTRKLRVYRRDDKGNNKKLKKNITRKRV